MDKKYILSGVLLVGVVAGLGALYAFKAEPNLNEKVYVAVEGDGTIAVIDPLSKKIRHAIDLSVVHDGAQMMFMPHNVQVSPDNKSVWVTANAGAHKMGRGNGLVNEAYAHGEEGSMSMPDQVIVIDPTTDTIRDWIPVAEMQHLAHVVLTPDSRYAYVTAQNAAIVYKINASTLAVEKKIAFPAGSEPHGLRIAPDGKRAYIAVLQGHALGIIDLMTDATSSVPLEGAAVQSGITPDGKYVVASLYDTKKLAVYEPELNALSYIPLPGSSRGPIQMYPTPDSKYIYLADQGYYYDQPAGNMVYKVDLAKGAVESEIPGGRAPHGVVVSPDGKTVYVSNLLSGDVFAFDTASDAKIAEIKVGSYPNGVSYWVRPE